MYHNRGIEFNLQTNTCIDKQSITVSKIIIEIWLIPYIIFNFFNFFFTTRFCLKKNALLSLKFIFATLRKNSLTRGIIET